MSTSDSSSNIVAANNLCDLFYDKAKFWWNFAAIMRVVAFIAGVASVARPDWATIFAMAVAALAVAAEGVSLLSDKRRSTAEQLRRSLDMTEGLGSELPARDIADVRAGISATVVKALDRESAPYFDSPPTPPGPMRLASNMEQSAWWSRHLSQTMVVAYSIVFVVLVSSSVVGLLAALNQSLGPDERNVVSRSVIVTIGFAFSTAVLRQLVSFTKFKSAAAKAEDRLARMAQTQGAEREVLRTVAEYHIARASAPLIPTFVHRARSERLNAEWNRLKSGT